MTIARRLRAAATALFLAGVPALAQPTQDNIGHERHKHAHNPPHPSVQDPARFHTSRDSRVDLPLPEEKDAFFFVVFGDRTGGPADGVSVLADAVRDANLLEPDFVMTVGDLINGYNRTPDWMRQMREYKSIMDELLCPWFPVAGNHDVYWRGPEGERPEGEHERNYEMHFGPLWYAFEHKNSWFVVLYSDEGNPETGEKTFNDPAAQRMSPEQFAWLKETLNKAKDADHVFIFVHHPRWLRGHYGDDWDKVHRTFVEAGNVSAVFAGHIHRMFYDSRDGIEYVTLATVGGRQSHTVPDAGWLHHFNIVTVRPGRIAMSAVPVGELLDVREITAALHNQAGLLADLYPAVEPAIPVEADGSARGEVSVRVANPTGFPIDATVLLDSADSRWFFAPDHAHARLEPFESRKFRFRVSRLSESIDGAFRVAEVVLARDLLGKSSRYEIPETRTRIPLDIRLPTPDRPAAETAMRFDGEDDHLLVPDRAFDLPDGPLTLECWFNAAGFSGRTALVTKTENSEYGFFVSDGNPSFFVHVGGSYITLEARERTLEPGRWYHIAGVYDGAEARLYLDGERIARGARAGPRRTNALPLIVGGDVDAGGRMTSPFHGMIDAVRLSSVARYSGESFEPERRPGADPDTVLLLNMDAVFGPWTYDESAASAHPLIRGAPEIVPAVR